MVQTVVLHLSDETARRYRRGALAARKPLEEFLVERLSESVPLAEQPASRLDDDLRQLEELSDEALWNVAHATLPPAQQRRYERLLSKNTGESLTAREQEELSAIGDEARHFTLKRAHAYLVLKWRGRALPVPNQVTAVR